MSKRKPVAEDGGRDGAAPASGAVTRVSVVRPAAGSSCWAFDHGLGCGDPLVRSGGKRWVVAVNVAVGPDGEDLPPGVRVPGARWDRLEVYHMHCYERVGRPRWGKPTRDARAEHLTASRRVAY